MKKYNGKDGKKLCYLDFKVEKPKATLHILHGMAEYAARYTDFAKYLNTFGISVYIQDHRGHGENVENNEVGFFAEKDGWKLIGDDSYCLDLLIRKENKDTKHFIMGHSMGSFLARDLISRYPELYDGAIIMGTGPSAGLLGSIGTLLAKMEIRRQGAKTTSVFLNSLALGSNNNGIQNPRTSCDWLSRDNDVVDAYIKDPLCGFVCPTSFYRDLIQGVKTANNKKLVKKVNKDMPILIISGDKDPVGHNGAGVKKVYSLYKSAGIKDLELNLIEGARHEVLNETDKDDTYKALSTWLCEKVAKC